MPTPSKRSILFVATTAEERGLLGAQYYVRHPLYPISKTILNINIDGLNLWGRTRDVELSGMGKSSADDIVAAIAAEQGRVVKPDSNVSYGSYYRGDQLEFARRHSDHLPAQQRRQAAELHRAALPHRQRHRASQLEHQRRGRRPEPAVPGRLPGRASQRPARGKTAPNPAPLIRAVVKGGR
jgi:hypothetical protein